MDKHTLSALSDPGVRVRSFTLTPTTLGLTISREVNIAKRERVRFARSLPTAQAKGGTTEALLGNPTSTVIPGVDVPKLTSRTVSRLNHPIVSWGSS